MNQDPALTVGLALATGIFAQAVARHTRLPGIVLLLATGVALGPDGLGWVQPRSLQAGLMQIVGVAMAVILFEGGMNLKFRALLRQAHAIPRLVTIGAMLTAVGATLAAHYVMGFEWRLSALFGTLVIVTGPTVVTPLLRRLRIDHATSTVLEAEGVMSDVFGALIAVIALDVALRPTAASFAVSWLELLMRLGFGMLVGLAGGGLIALLLRVRNLVPEGLENVFTLAFAVALFEGANSVFHESGIATAVFAGLVVGNAESHALRELHSFKEQLTVLLIGLLFVLLAADVRLSDVRELGTPALLTVLCLMFVVRPAAVALSTWGSDLNWRQRAFISWIGPRGIVAAAVASLFGSELTAANIPGGTKLRALVFVVIAVTVTSAGLTGGVLAWALKLSRPRNSGWVVLGANGLARAVAQALGNSRHETVSVDANPDACRKAEAMGLRVVFGNALEEKVLARLEPATRRGVVALTPNEEVNYLFCQRVRSETRDAKLYVALESMEGSVTPAMVAKLPGVVLFDKAADVDLWTVRMRHHEAEIERWRSGRPDANLADLRSLIDAGDIMPLVIKRRDDAFPVEHGLKLKQDDLVTFAIWLSSPRPVKERLRALGFSQVEERGSRPPPAPA